PVVRDPRGGPAERRPVADLLHAYPGTPTRLELLDDSAVRDRIEQLRQDRRAVVAATRARAAELGYPIPAADDRLPAPFAAALARAEVERPAPEVVPVEAGAGPADALLSRFGLEPGLASLLGSAARARNVVLDVVSGAGQPPVPDPTGPTVIEVADIHNADGSPLRVDQWAALNEWLAGRGIAVRN